MRGQILALVLFPVTASLAGSGLEPIGEALSGDIPTCLIIDDLPALRSTLDAADPDIGDDLGAVEGLFGGRLELDLVTPALEAGGDIDWVIPQDVAILATAHCPIEQVLLLEDDPGLSSFTATCSKDTVFSVPGTLLVGGHRPGGARRHSGDRLRPQGRRRPATRRAPT